MSEKRFGLLSILLGLWLIATALTWGHFDPISISDCISGFLCVIVGCLIFKLRYLGWFLGILGLWLQLAPLIFWAPHSFQYINDTLIGILAIIIAFLVNKKTESKAAFPVGWSYNPSAWSHRIPTVLLASICWFFSRYMAAFEMGYIDSIWDPVFGKGTMDVITSKISRDFPVPDAGLGALCYTLEALLGWQGGVRRWAEMPWLVLGFGFLVIPVGIVSITLIVLQPVSVGAWCFWCLATAACMLLMIVLTAGEVMASLQLLVQSKQKGESVWKTFWYGQKVPHSLPVKPRQRTTKCAWGFSFPYNLIITTLLGIWLMTSPAFLGTKGSLETAFYIVGPVVTALSVIACAEVFRIVRYVNILLGIFLLTAPWFLPHSCLICCVVNSMVVGLLVIIFSLRRGKIIERYSLWNPCIK